MDSCSSAAASINHTYPIGYHKYDAPVKGYSVELFGSLPKEDLWVDIIKRIIMAALAPLAYVALGFVALIGRLFVKKTCVDFVERIEGIEIELALEKYEEALSLWTSLAPHIKKLPTANTKLKKVHALFDALRSSIVAAKKRPAIPEPRCSPPTRSRQTSRGLQNLGNTCFINSVAQALLLAPQSERLLQNSSKIQEHEEVREHLARIAEGLQGTGREKSNALHQLTTLIPSFTVGTQDCGRDFLRTLLTRIGTIGDSELGFHMTTVQVTAPEGYVPNIGEDPRSIDNPLIESLGACPMFELLQPCKADTSLQDQIELTFTKEPFPPTEATASGSTVQSQREALIAKESMQFLSRIAESSPENVIIDLKRDAFTQAGATARHGARVPGIMEPIELPTHTRTGNSFALDTIEQYEPYAWLVHKGSLSGGHWVAYRKDPTTGDISLYSDTSVTSPSHAEILRDLEKNCATVFYQKANS